MREDIVLAAVAFDPAVTLQSRHDLRSIGFYRCHLMRIYLRTIWNQSTMRAAPAPDRPASARRKRYQDVHGDPNLADD
jgi:hypothetical protein